MNANYVISYFFYDFVSSDVFTPTKATHSHTPCPSSTAESYEARNTTQASVPPKRLLCVTVLCVFVETEPGITHDIKFFVKLFSDRGGKQKEELVLARNHIGQVGGVK